MEIKALKSSPLFNLSLSSKELFHSNFLAWIGDTYPQMFVEILKRLGCKCNWSDRNFCIMREYQNFDLCVLDSNKKDVLLVLENKVKSIPYKKQLDKYEKKLNNPSCDLILLSLATKFPDKGTIKKEGEWIVRGYDNLYTAIVNCKKHVTDQYHLSLIEDYCTFIKNLHDLSSTWMVNSDDLFVSKIKEDKIDDLRINDVRDKFKHSQLCANLKDELEKNVGVKVESGLVIDEIKDKEFLEEVFINWGFTHGLGLIEAKVKVNDRYVLLVQIQGNRYCHGIEWIKDDESALHPQYWEETKVDDFVQRLSFFQFGDVDNAAFPESTNGSITFKKHKGEDVARNYAKYGNKFLYQAKNIKSTATIKDVIYGVVADIKRIFEESKKSE